MRRVDEYLGPPLCIALGWLRTLAARIRRPRPDTPLPMNASFLVIKFWGMGSIVLTTPALRALRKRYPECRITFLTFAHNEAVCGMIPAIDRVYGFRAGSLIEFMTSCVELLRLLRRERFDAVVDFEFFANFTSIVTALSAAPTRVGFRSPKVWRERFYTRSVPFAHTHITENFLAAVAAIDAPADGCQLDRFVMPDAATQRLEALVPRAASHVVCVNVNASSLDYKRRWPPASYRELIRRLLTAYPDWTVVLIGAKEDEAYVAEVLEPLPAGPALRNLCGRLTVPELAALLQRSHLFIGNDSGPLHLAVAAGIPTVSFFGPETPDLYGPRGDAHAILYQGIACSPCLNVYNSKNNSFCRDNVCLKSITVDAAWSAVCERIAAAERWPSQRVGQSA